jgi:hypothetical protein
MIERLDVNALADLIYAFGEERMSRRIARRIKADLEAEGVYSGTAGLAYAVAGCYPPKARRGRIHPATRTFQALRIAVNDELAVLDRLLQIAPDWLKPDGLLAIISFHSLEDRRVKTAFLQDERLERVTRKPLMASEQEQADNPRSRSAKLRIARRRPTSLGLSHEYPLVFRLVLVDCTVGSAAGDTRHTFALAPRFDLASCGWIDLDRCGRMATGLARARCCFGVVWSGPCGRSAGVGPGLDGP